MTHGRELTLTFQPMELLVSIGIVTAVICIADVSLAFQGNWPKIVRITLAAATYVFVLGVLLRSTGRLGAPPARLPYWVFLVAGVAAGAASGFLRADGTIRLALAQTILTPLALGTFHWVALQRWAWVRSRITARKAARR
jgi:hypothetical protein